MYLVGVLRVDVLARETPVPLVPYAKAGFGYALWWAGDGDGTAHDDNGVIGRGHSFGFQYALGGMLLLDAFDRASAVEIDSNTGVNNTYFFLEWYNSFLGQSGDQMQVGTNTWMLGPSSRNLGDLAFSPLRPEPPRDCSNPQQAGARPPEYSRSPLRSGS